MKKFIVRYGAMRSLGAIDCHDRDSHGLFHGVRVVVKTQRGYEAATILCETNDEKIKNIPNLTTEQTRYVRRLTKDDEERLLEIKRNERADFDRCLKIVMRMKVDLTLVRVEQILGRERVVVYYVADGRVDFRELVRALAAEFQTRIEMKQIGVRDETKLLADVGDCGREVCCNTYLINMPPVSMKMAKLQKATLDPTKVSGRCGRLKCCLRYEYDVYNELQEGVPTIGSIVRTSMGVGQVFAQELFAKKVVVDLEEGGRQSFAVDEIEVIKACERHDHDHDHDHGHDHGHEHGREHAHGQDRRRGRRRDDDEFDY